MAEVTHLCPPGDEVNTPCCGRSVFDLVANDRMTVIESLVTCPQMKAPPTPWVFHSQDRFTHMINGGCPAYFAGTNTHFCDLERGHDTKDDGTPNKRAFHQSRRPDYQDNKWLPVIEPIKWDGLTAAQGRNDPSWHYLRMGARTAPPALRSELEAWADELEATDCEDPWKRCGECRTCNPPNGLEATLVVCDELDELLDMTNHRTSEGSGG